MRLCYCEWCGLVFVAEALRPEDEDGQGTGENEFTAEVGHLCRGDDMRFTYTWLTGWKEGVK